MTAINGGRSSLWSGLYATVLVGLLLPGSIAAATGNPAVSQESSSASASGRNAQPGRAARQELSIGQISRAIAQFVEAQLAGQVNAVQVDVLEPQEGIAVPSGALQIIVREEGSDGGARRQFRVVPTVGGRAQTPIDVFADVTLLADVVTPILSFNGLLFPAATETDSFTLTADGI